MIELTIHPDGKEPFEVTATARDIYLWEKTHRGRTFSQFKDEVSMSMLYEIAHVTCRRQGLFDGSLELMGETCELEFIGETAAAGADVDPTRPAASPAAS